MAIILDADVVIRGEKGTFDLKSWVKSRPNDRFEIAAITVAELWHGVERATGTHKVTRQRYLDAVLQSLPIIPYTEQTAYEHAHIWAELEDSGKMIGFYDLIVGATAPGQGTIEVFCEPLSPVDELAGNPKPKSLRRPDPHRMNVNNPRRLHALTFDLLPCTLMGRRLRHCRFCRRVSPFRKAHLTC